jgi:DNA-nicking Smr family endonuclease|tara:strand:+ start:1058 stop:1471 length:414 start_codon:yes stop_codon:yes gene_type:complete
LSSKISNKDKKDWENFLSKNEKLTNKDDNLIKKEIKKSITFDLHGYSLDEANKQVKDLIFEAYNNKINKLIIVTGKGLHSQNEKDPYVSKNLSILKYSVPEYITNDKELTNMINEIKEANIEDGGAGAFYIFIKKKL